MPTPTCACPSGRPSASIPSRGSLTTWPRTFASALLLRHGVLLDVGVDPPLASSAWPYIVECFGILHAVLLAQIAASRHAEFLDVVPVGGHIVVAKQRQSLIATTM